MLQVIFFKKQGATYKFYSAAVKSEISLDFFMNLLHYIYVYLCPRL